MYHDRPTDRPTDRPLLNFSSSAEDQSIRSPLLPILGPRLSALTPLYVTSHLVRDDLRCFPGTRVSPPRASAQGDRRDAPHTLSPILTANDCSDLQEGNPGPINLKTRPNLKPVSSRRSHHERSPLPAFGGSWEQIEFQGLQRETQQL
jgi:hypothetical protein